MSNQVVQTSFQGGMIERYKQDQFQHSGAFQSALFLNNFDPNVETGSVVKRPGTVTLFKTFPTSDKEYNGNILSKFTNTATIHHADVLPVSNTLTNDNFVLFVKRQIYNALGLDADSHAPSYITDALSSYSGTLEGTYIDNTAILGHNVYYDVSNNSHVNWREPFALNSDYPGWYVLGTYQDSSKYGEMIAFCTKLEKYKDITITEALQKLLYPVYIWSLWDLTKKKEKNSKAYLNGLFINDLSNKEKYSKFKIKKPVQSWLNNKEVGFAYFDSNQNKLIPENRTKLAPISVVIFEEDLRRNSYYSFENYWRKRVHSSTGDMGYNQLFENERIGRWYNHTVPVLYSMQVPKFTELDTIIDEIRSMNCMNIDNLNGKWIGISEDYTGSEFCIYKNVYRTTFMDHNTKTYDVIILPHIAKSWIAYSPIAGSIYNGYSSHPMAISDDTSSTLFTEDTTSMSAYYDFANQGGNQPASTYSDAYGFGGERGRDFRKEAQNISGVYDNKFLLTIPIMMPNYVEADLPRPWTKDEIIPLLVTFNFNGHEVVMAETNYKVKRKCNFIGPSPLAYNVILYKAKSMAIANMIYKLHESGGVFLTSMDTSELPLEMARIRNGRSEQTYKSLEQCSERYEVYPYNVTTGMRHSNITIKRWNTLYVTLRINESALSNLIAEDITSIKVYVARPDLTKKGLMPYIGRWSQTEYSGGYMYPIIPSLQKQSSESESNVDYSQYGLVKEFLISGESSMVYDDKEKEANFNRPTNGWNYYADGYSDTENPELSLWAVPIQDELHDAGNIVNLTYRTNLIKQVEPTIGENIDSADFVRYKADFYAHLPSTEDLIVNHVWTPDFCIKDYAYDSDSLTLNTDGKYWKGIGAELICSIKNRIFISRCIDKFGILEQATIRYSAVQNGVVIGDLFNEQDKLQVGHNNHTAMFEFREQLVVMDENSFYRIVMPNIFDETEWEFLEAMHGQGTLSQKYVTVTPNGFVFGNRNSIWLSQGNMPIDIAEPVQGIYQRLATNAPLPYGNLVNPGSVIINENGYNPYLEVLYNSEKDEIAIITPIKSYGDCFENSYDDAEVGGIGAMAIPTKDTIFENQLDTEFRLIYSFKNKNWRCETYPLQNLKYREINDDPSKAYGYELNVQEPNIVNGIEVPEDLEPSIRKELTSYISQSNLLLSDYSPCKTWADKGRMHFDLAGIITTRKYLPAGAGYGIAYTPGTFFEHAVTDKVTIMDIYGGYKPALYTGQILTHEIADGEDDYIFRRAIIEAIPRMRFLYSIPLMGIVHELYGVEDYGWGTDAAQPVTPKRLLDPRIYFENRNIPYASYLRDATVQETFLQRWMDLGSLNIIPRMRTANDRINHFRSNMQTPYSYLTSNSNLYDSTNFDTDNKSYRESIILLSRLNTKYRRGRFAYCSEITAKVYGIRLEHTSRRRRSI